MKISGCIAVLWLLFLTGCLTDREEFSDRVDLEVSAGDIVRSAVSYGSIDVTYLQKKTTLPWVSCQLKSEKKAFILALPNIPKTEKPLELCQSSVAQAFLTHKINVFAVRMPGFTGKGSGPDLGGRVSQAALGSFAASVQGKYADIYDLAGFWTYGELVPAVLFHAKKESFKGTVIIGGGFYDLEVVQNRLTDGELKSRIADLVAKEGDKALEVRSIAWDPSGLPSVILIYHGENDLVFSAKGAKAFRDIAAAQGHKAELVIIPEVKHQFSENLHRSAIENLLRTVGGTSKSGE